MSRITERKKDRYGNEYIATCGGAYFEDESVYKALEKLAHYEDLEEQGRLIVLPCKVGDTVWEIRGVRWKGYDWKFPVYDNASVTGIKFNLEMLPRIGKKAFLTKEEAEAKLAELKGTEE